MIKLEIKLLLIFDILMIIMYKFYYFRFVSIVKRKILNGLLFILVFISVLIVLVSIDNMVLFILLLNLPILISGIISNCYLCKKDPMQGPYSILENVVLLPMVIDILIINHQLSKNIKQYLQIKFKLN